MFRVAVRRALSATRPLVDADTITRTVTTLHDTLDALATTPGARDGDCLHATITLHCGTAITLSTTVTRSLDDRAL